MKLFLHITYAREDNVSSGFVSADTGNGEVFRFQGRKDFQSLGIVYGDDECFSF